MKDQPETLTTPQTYLTKSLFAIYFIVLIWIIFFKMAFSLAELPSLRAVNLIPYADSVMINHQMDFSEIYLNVVIFMPFGVYMTMLKAKWTFRKLIIPIIVTSFLMEVAQYTFAIGATDITDLIGNTFGGILGILLYTMIDKLYKHNIIVYKTFNLLALIGTIGFLILSTIIFLVNT